MAAIDLGDPLPDFGVTVYDATGAPANAGTVTVTLTYPDGVGGIVTRTGSSAGGGDLVVTNTPPGLYTSSWVTTALGEHRARWVATGANASAHEQSWVVGGVDLILSLEAARTYLGVSKPSEADELRELLEAVSDLCEWHTRKTWRRTIVVDERHDGTTWRRPAIVLSKRPVAQVTAVRVKGVTVTDWHVNRSTGELWRGTSGAVLPWLCGLDDVAVDYVAGPVDGRIPARIVEGCKLQAGFQWDTRRGGSNLPRRSGSEDDINPAESLLAPRVRQLWGTPRPLVG